MEKQIDERLRDLIKKATEVLKAAGAQEVYVFGSACTGAMQDNSDIDIAVSGLPPAAFFKAVGQLGDVLGRRFDLIDLDEESPFTRYLREEGELLRVA